MITSENYTTWLKTMLAFHHYSLNNTILIALQAPEASRVASYETWKKLKRQVRKGEKGIKILVPAPVKVKKEVERRDPVTSLPILDADGNPVKDIEEYSLQHFKIGHVFAYEQTDGEPLPSLGVDELTGTAAGYERMKQAITDISPVPIRFDEVKGGAKGYYSPLNKEIVINTGMSELQTIKTIVHELAHSMCHDRDTMMAKGIKKDRQTKEVEAESVAYTVCQYFGLDTSDYSFAYVTGWSSSKEMKELRSSMEFIRETSAIVIDRIHERMEDLECSPAHSSVISELSRCKELAAYPSGKPNNHAAISSAKHSRHSEEILS